MLVLAGIALFSLGATHAAFYSRGRDTLPAWWGEHEWSLVFAASVYSMLLVAGCGVVAVAALGVWAHIPYTISINVAVGKAWHDFERPKGWYAFGRQWRRWWVPQTVLGRVVLASALTGLAVWRDWTVGDVGAWARECVSAWLSV